jgi:D-serine deaminase-like pyridoxal phosphate-dependent protein
MRFPSIGLDKQEIDTPALLIDLDILEKNIKIMADYYSRKKGAALRPHQKGHRLPIIARKQLNAGAKGVSMTSLGLAEYYVQSGIKDILITNEIYGDNKIARLCSLSKHAEITVGVDNLDNVRHLSEMALARNTIINVAVELYMGRGSCGVEIGKAKSFVKEIMKFKGVNFKGLWWHQGSLGRIKSWDERKKLHFETLDKVAALKDEIEDCGINVEMLSGGFTATWNITPEYPRLSNVNVQAGSYVFSDWCSHLIEGLEVFDYALTVLTRCISRPASDEAMFDFGMNTCADECTYDYRMVVGPKFKNLDGVKEIREREEISLVVFDHPRTDIKVGDVFELIPPHSDTTAKLHDIYYGIRNNKLEVIWPNYGRGLF